MTHSVRRATLWYRYRWCSIETLGDILRTRWRPRVDIHFQTSVLAKNLAARKNIQPIIPSGGFSYSISIHRGCAGIKSIGWVVYIMGLAWRRHRHSVFGSFVRSFDRLFVLLFVPPPVPVPLPPLFPSLPSPVCPSLFHPRLFQRFD